MRFNIGGQRVQLAGRAVAEAQSERASAIRPGEAAAPELAKGRFGVAIGDSIQRLNNAATEASAQLQRQNDTQAQKRIANGLRLKMDALDAQDIQDPDAYQEAVQELFTQARDQYGDIQSPLERQNFTELFELELENYQAHANAATIKIRHKAQIDSMNDDIAVAMAGGDFEAARDMLANARANKVIDTEAQAKSLGQIQKVENEYVAGMAAKRVDQAFSLGEDEGNAELAQIMRREGAYADLTDEQRDMAIDAAEEKKSEWGKVQQAEADRTAASFMLAYGNDTERAERGMMSPEEIDAAYTSGRYGDPKDEKTAQRRNSLISHALDAMEKEQDVLDVQAALSAGAIPNDKKSRTALAEYEQRTLQTLAPEEQLAFIADVSRQAKTVSTTTSEVLSTGGRSVGALERNYELWAAINSDPATAPDMHIGETADLYASMHQLVVAGMEPNEAAQVAWDGYDKRLDASVRQSRQFQYDNEIAPAFTGFMDDFMNEAYDPGLFASEPEPPQEMIVEAGTIYRQVFMATGSEAAARQRATDSIKRNWKATNINGDWEVQRYGLEGDVEVFRPRMIQQATADTRGLKVNVNGVERSLAEISDDEIRFEPMKPEGNQQRFKVWVGESPVHQVTERGIQVLAPLVNLDTLITDTQTDMKRKEIETRMAEIDKTRERLENFALGRPFINERDKESASRKIKALENEREYQQQQLEQIGF